VSVNNTEEFLMKLHNIKNLAAVAAVIGACLLSVTAVYAEAIDITTVDPDEPAAVCSGSSDGSDAYEPPAHAGAAGAWE
jgi:hypothetical protein